MKTKFLAAVITTGILSAILGSYLYLDQPKTPWDCRQKYGKVAEDIQNCLDGINQKFSVIPQAFGYHEERERQETLRHTGLYTKNMEYVLFPRVDTEYHLQIVIDNQQYENITLNVGYGINNVEKIPHRLVPDHPTEYPYFERIQQLSSMKDSTEFHTEGMELPIIVNFTINFEETGLHQYRYFEQRKGPNLGGGSSGGGYMVVSQYSKAVTDDGSCKNTELLPLPKHDFSKLVCVTPHGHHELITRGWAPLPG